MHFMILYDTFIIYLYIHAFILNFCALLLLQLMLGKGPYHLIFLRSTFYCLRKCLRSRIDFGAFRLTETAERLIFSNARV